MTEPKQPDIKEVAAAMAHNNAPYCVHHRDMAMVTLLDFDRAVERVGILTAQVRYLEGEVERADRRTNDGDKPDQETLEKGMRWTESFVDKPCPSIHQRHMMAIAAQVRYLEERLKVEKSGSKPRRWNLDQQPQEATMGRAEKLRDQVLKTWNPPLIQGNECAADIAQTATMQTLQWCHPCIFDGLKLTESQLQALEGGGELLERILGGDGETQHSNIHV